MPIVNIYNNCYSSRRQNSSCDGSCSCCSNGGACAAPVPAQVVVGHSVAFRLASDDSFVMLNGSGQFATGGAIADALRFVVTKVNAGNPTTIRLYGSSIEFNASDVTLNPSNGQPPLTNLWTGGGGSGATAYSAAPPLGYGRTNTFSVESGGKTWKQGDPITLGTFDYSPFYLEYLGVSPVPTPPSPTPAPTPSPTPEWKSDWKLVSVSAGRSST